VGPVPRGLIIGLAVLGLGGCAATASPSSGAPTNGASPSAAPLDTPLPTIDPGATLAPSLPPHALDLSALGWQTVVPELDPTTQETIGHWLAVGTLNSEDPTWFEPLTEMAWRFDVFADQGPVVDGPTGGQVLYVSDDGVSSEVRVVDIHGTQSALIGTTDAVVFTARLSPDGQSAYVVLLERATGRDRGVFRVLVGGDGSFEQVIGPPTVDTAGAPAAIRLVAADRFVRTLRISADGSEVARLACGEPFGQCVFDLLEVADGSIARYNNPGGQSDLVAIGDSYVLGGWHCLPDENRCVTDGFGLARGMPEEMRGWPPALDAGGHLVMLQFPPPTVEARGFFITDLDGSNTRLVFASDFGVRPIFQEGADFEGTRMELPWGWVAVQLDRVLKNGQYQMIPAAVRLADGGWVRLTLPSLYPIGGGHD